jgi:PPP family 3-phenylpropionic acid transporter
MGVCSSVWSGRYPGWRGAARWTIGSLPTGPLTHTRSVTLRRLKSLYAIEGAAFGLLMPFPVPLLVERGLGAAQIGLILGLAGIASLAAYPIWGAVADGWLGRPRTIALTAVTAAIGGLWVMLAGSDPVVLTLALSVALMGAMSWGPLIDALTLGELGDASSSYGRIRVWASVGWAISATVGGAMWMLAGPAPVFTTFIICSLLVAALVLWPNRAEVLATASSDSPDGPGAARAVSARPSLRSWLPLFMAPVLLGFLVGLLITSLGEHASWRFISLRILDQGGGVFLVGLAAALPGLVEIPVFANSRRMVARMGLRWVFVSGAALAAVLMALVAVATEPWMVTALRTLDGASYALRYLAMVMIIGLLLPRHLYAMGQSVAWFVYAGIAPIIADAAGGLIYDAYGASALFAVATAALALGGAIVWVALRGPRFGPHGDAAVSGDPPAPPPPA